MFCFPPAREKQEIQVPSADSIVVGWLGVDKMLVSGPAAVKGGRGSASHGTEHAAQWSRFAPKVADTIMIIGSPDGKQVLCPSATGGGYLYSCLQCQLGNLHWQDSHLLDHQLASLHYPGALK